jgi:hypothetical protein
MSTKYAKKINQSMPAGRRRHSINVRSEQFTTARNWKIHILKCGFYRNKLCVCQANKLERVTPKAGQNLKRNRLRRVRRRSNRAGECSFFHLICSFYYAKKNFVILALYSKLLLRGSLSAEQSANDEELLWIIDPCSPHVPTVGVAVACTCKS